MSEHPQHYIYDALLENYENTDDPDKNTVFSGDIQTYLDAVDDLEKYNSLFRADEANSTENAFVWLSSQPLSRRQTLYDFYALVKNYISIKVDEAVNRQHERISGDTVSDIITNLTLMWPLSYEIVNSKRFKPQKYGEELYPDIASEEEAEAEILKADTGADLSRQLQDLRRLTKLLKSRYNIDSAVREVLEMQTAVIGNMAKRFGLEVE